MTRLPTFAPWRYSPTPGQIGQSSHDRTHLVFESVLAAGVAGPIDSFTVANSLGAKVVGLGRKPFQKFTWSTESLDGLPVRSASGQTIALDGKIDPRARTDAVVATAPFVDINDPLMDRREQVDVLSKAIRH
jgi:transcriptional regulator GlxA family with amidase domain